MYHAIEWFTKNPVAANLLMVVLLLGGALALFNVHQEEFPSVDPDVVSISVPYLGAAPEEAEAGVCVRVEEAIEGVEGIDKIRTTAAEGACSVLAELNEDTNAIQTLNEIKSQVDGISTLPEETEKPIVSKITISGGVMELAISGNTDERALKEIGREIRDDIAAMDGVSKVELKYARPYEMSIEIAEATLQRYGLTLDQVAQTIRAASLDMPGGTLRTKGGEILLRTKGQLYLGEDFEKVVVLTAEDGTRVTVGDLGTVIDGFQEGDIRARFDNQPAVVVKVWRIGKEDIIAIAEDVIAYVDNYRATRLPEGLTITIWNDESKQLESRVNTLVRTAVSGLVLVLVILTLFLRFRLAMWVAAGIPIALAGTIALFPAADISISTMTVMAFILVLGILVDDAIVVGERVYAFEQKGESPIRAAIEGTREVSIPVIFGVLTTMAAFLPLLLVPGRMNDFFGVIGTVVIIALFFSVIESQLILPAHLAHRNHEAANTAWSKRWNSVQDFFSSGLQNFANNTYLPFLRRAIEWRYVTAAIGVGILILAIALIASGRVIFQFFPAVEGDRVFASLEMPEGIDVEVTAAAARLIEDSVRQLKIDLDQDHAADKLSTIRHILVSVGTSVGRGGPRLDLRPGRSHFAEIAIELAPLKERDNLSAKIIAEKWRKLVGNIPDAVSLSFSAAAYSAGDPINYQLSGRSVEQLAKAAAEMRAELARYTGVHDISDSFRAGKQEISLSLLPQARHLGITQNDFARQVRAAFYGVQAQRIQRGPDDVRIMVRFPDNERRSIGNLEDMTIRAPNGTLVPFTSVASFTLGRGFSSINRVDGARVVNVKADVDRSKVSPEEINASFMADVVPDMRLRYPDMKIGLSGEQEERTKAMAGLAQGSLLALVVIYALLAIPLRSYIQPLVIMSVIPFGAVGAIVGHYIMGQDLVFFSLLGIVALSGVVVNASLVLVDFVNRKRLEGLEQREAVLISGAARFRPIVLTSATTFVGLIPLMTNSDPSTFFVIPMAISLAFGVLFATTITLILVPSLYSIAEDFTTWGGRIEDEPESTGKLSTELVDRYETPI